MQPIGIGIQIMSNNPLAEDLIACTEYKNGINCAKKTQIPSNVILAAEDKNTPYRFGLELAGLLNAETTTISNAGHMLPIESPKNTLDAIKSFILKNILMSNQIKKVGVIGAGTMGAGIAGQVANAGIEVWLLDLPSDGENVNSLSAKGLERLKDPDMPGLMSVEAEKLIRLGNTRDHFHELEDCDWVAEAVVERLDIKQALYQRLNEQFARNQQSSPPTLLRFQLVS